MFRITFFGGILLMPFLLCSCSFNEKISQDQSNCETTVIQERYQPKSYKRLSGFDEWTSDDKQSKFITWNFREMNMYGVSIENQAKCYLRKEDYIGMGKTEKTKDFHVWSTKYKR